jgi:hypothetical protein
MRARHLVVAVLIAALTSRPGAAASLMPELIGGVGGTAAVQGGPGSGGLSFALSAMWPVDENVRFGAMGFADDLGDRTTRLTDSQGVDLGPVSALHQAARGLAGRAEAQMGHGRRYGAFAVGTWGVYRVSDDVRGARIRRTNAGGLGAGFGLTRTVTATQTAGLTLRYQQLWRGAIQRYLSVAMEWRWHRSVKD